MFRRPPQKRLRSPGRGESLAVLARATITLLRAMTPNIGPITRQELLARGLGDVPVVPHQATPKMDVDSEERQDAPEGAADSGDKPEGSVGGGNPAATK